MFIKDKASLALYNQAFELVEKAQYKESIILAIAELLQEKERELLAHQAKFTSALSVISTDADLFGKHLTLSFCDAVKSGKFQTSIMEGPARIIDVQYWERVNLTVLILDSDFARARHEYYQSLGYTYDLEWIPHITYGKGNLVDNIKDSYLDRNLILGREYARTY